MVGLTDEATEEPAAGHAHRLTKTKSYGLHLYIFFVILLQKLISILTRILTNSCSILDSSSKSSCRDFSSSELNELRRRARNRLSTIKFPMTRAGKKMAKHVSDPCRDKKG